MIKIIIFFAYGFGVGRPGFTGWQLLPAGASCAGSRADAPGDPAPE